jgi:hypothetical protein
MVEKFLNSRFSTNFVGGATVVNPPTTVADKYSRVGPEGAQYEVWLEPTFISGRDGSGQQSFNALRAKSQRNLREEAPTDNPTID